MRLLSNGRDGDSGAPLLPPPDYGVVAEKLRAAGSEPDLEHAVRRRRQEAEPSAGAIYGTKIDDLESAGWAVIIPSGTDPTIVDALEPLIDHRRDQAGKLFVQVSEHEKFSFNGETKNDFLIAIGAPPYGRVEPSRFPYFVLLVGGPDAISYQFQREMSIQHAVGRVSFDGADDYRRYAEAVVAADVTTDMTERRLRLLAARHVGDDATALSEERLVAPLLAAAQGWLGAERIVDTIGPSADRDQFVDAFSDTSSVVFTAGHGIGFSAGHGSQRTLQGALLTSSWKSVEEPMQREYYVAAEDLRDANPAGKIVFNFACFSAGTPQLDDFARLDEKPAPLSDAPFTAALPKALLSHENGCALACVGHVDRAWGYSFVGDGLVDQTAAYRELLHMVLDGHRIGHALEPFGELYAETSATYLESVRRWRDGLRPNQNALIEQWVAAVDAGGFVILGDPAVRLPGGVLQ